MKNMIKIQYIICALLLVSVSSCMDDDLNYPDPNKPVVTANVSNATIGEGAGSITVTLNLSRAIGDPADIKFEQVSGNADADDYTFSIGDLDEYEIGPAGYQTSIPATMTSTQVTITPSLDLDVEGPETATFRIVQGQNGLATVDGGEIVFTVTIADFEYCLWTLDVFDNYGDSWQGAHVTITQDGLDPADYPDGDWDDDAETYQIPVGVGATFSFTYVSGTTGDQPNQAGAPGYEEENSYILTSPDGTVYADGPIPAVGVIVSGTNNCN